jgi:hypothetical protein
MPHLIEVHRSGSVVWVTVDGWTMPIDWVVDAHACVDPDRMPQVTLTFSAATVEITNSVHVLGVDSGEVERQEAQEPAEERVRLPE